MPCNLWPEAITMLEPLVPCFAVSELVTTELGREQKLCPSGRLWIAASMQMCRHYRMHLMGPMQRLLDCEISSSITTTQQNQIQSASALCDLSSLVTGQSLAAVSENI
eukprot:1092720-Amphidinium_carterae.1